MSEFAAWKRLDRQGRDAAVLRPQGDGWVLQGAAAFEHELGSASVAYRVETDTRLATRRGLISGVLGERTIRREIRREAEGWSLDGVPVNGLEHLADLDFGFTPATNVLQLMRMALAPSERADLPVAWLDLDSEGLTQLPQTYERRSESSYWYEAPTVPYRALLEIAPSGFVQQYPGLWRLCA